MAKVSLTKLKLETKYDETKILKWNNEVRPLLLGDPAVQNC